MPMNAIWVYDLAQGRFNMQTGGTEEKITDLPVSTSTAKATPSA